MSARTAQDTMTFVQQFTQLGQEKDSEKRLHLLRSVTDLYLSHEATPTFAEEHLFSEIVHSVVRKLQPDERPQVSTRLSESGRVPHSLAIALASDSDIAVASPILSRSPVLTEGDIVALAETSGDAHLQAIASRPSLTAKVTDVLIDRGSNSVLRTVSGNAGAEISEKGMLNLITRASADDDLSLALADRGDLSSAMMAKLSALICDRFARGGEGADTDHVAANLPSRVRALIQEELRKRKDNIDSTDRVIAAVEERTLLLNDGLRPLFAGGRLLDVSKVVAHFLQFDRNFVFRQIATGEINTVVLMYRALDMDYTHLEATLALRARKRRDTGRTETVSRTDYDAIVQADAQRAMRFLKVRMTTGKLARSASGDTAAMPRNAQLGR